MCCLVMACFTGATGLITWADSPVPGAGYHASMSRLHTEYLRLYLPPGADGTGDQTLVGRDGRVRALVLGLRQPADWATLSAVWRGVQADLGWPAPVIAVNGVDAFELWFSLAEAVPASEAFAVLDGLRRRYLPDVTPDRLCLWPTADAAPWSAARIPALQTTTGGWSAFVAPDLPAVFGDEPTLDFQPGDDAQAELLGRTGSVRAADWRAAQTLLQAAGRAASITVSAPAVPEMSAPAGGDTAALNGPYQDPRSFLLDVMNHPAVALELRIRAAQALLTP